MNYGVMTEAIMNHTHANPVLSLNLSSYCIHVFIVFECRVIKISPYINMGVELSVGERHWFKDRGIGGRSVSQTEAEDIRIWLSLAVSLVRGRLRP